MPDAREYVIWLRDPTSDGVALVGGKNASLGEMIQRLGEVGLEVPDGFATTAKAYWAFLDANELRQRMRGILDEFHERERSLKGADEAIRRLLRRGEPIARTTASIT